MNKYLYISKIIVIFISIFYLFTNPSKAESSKGYSILEPQTQDSLIYKTLENSETYTDIKSCFNKIELTRYPEMISKLNNQAICFDKYSIAGELRTKLDNTNKSLEKLNLYKQITELALNTAIEINNNIKSGNTKSTDKYDFLIIPKGELVETKIQKDVKHKPQCKIDNIYNSKIPVQSCENKEVSFSIFVENTKDQINRIRNNFTDLQQMIKRLKKDRFDTIETINLNMKSSYLANDLTLLNTENFEIIKSNLISTKDTSSFVELTISDNNQINSRNPSRKIMNIRVKYPELDQNLNMTSQENFDLPAMYLETFEEEIAPKIIAKIEERLNEYKKIINNLSKNQQTLLTSLSTIEKDKSCYNNQITSNTVQELNVDQNMSSFEKQTFVSFIGDILNRTVSGVKSTFYSVSDNTKQLIAINSSPTPTPGIYKVINPSTSPTINTSPTPYPSSTPKPSSTPVFTIRPTPSPSSTPRPSSTPVFTAKPTPIYSYSPKPTPTNTIKPSPIPSPTNTIKPSPTPTNPIYSTPTPTPSYSPKPTPSLSPTPVPTPNYSPRTSTTTTPTPSTTPIP